MTKSQTIQEWALSKIGCPYVFASHGEKCTVAWRQHQMSSKPAYAANIKKYCPVLSGRQKTCDGCKYQGKPAYDCSGLTKEAAKLVGIALPHGASSQWKGAYWDAKGTLDQMPRDRLCFVFNETDTADPMGHVGIYLGDGTVVDARGHAAGVLRSPLSGYAWDHYAILKGTTGEGVTAVEALSVGARGAMVENLQKLLNAAGYDCGAADGIFGPKTEAAVKRLQETYSLPVTGIADGAAQAALAAAVQTPKQDAKALARAVYEAIKNYL